MSLPRAGNCGTISYPEEREKNITAPLAVGDTVYLANNTLGFAALKLGLERGRWAVSRLWCSGQEKTHYSSPILGPGCLYFHNSKRALKCLDLADGSIRWTAAPLGTQYGALLSLPENRLLAMLDDGLAVLLTVSPREYIEEARFQALGKCFPQPAVAGGKLYVRDHERLVCFDLQNPGDVADKAGLSTAATAATAVQKRPAPGGPAAGTKRARPARTGSFPPWEDMGNAFYVGWLSGALLALLGVLAVKRRQLLAGAAVIQSATLAAALAMWLDGLQRHAAFFHEAGDGFGPGVRRGGGVFSRAGTRTRNAAPAFWESVGRVGGGERGRGLHLADSNGHD